MVTTRKLAEGVTLHFGDCRKAVKFIQNGEEIYAVDRFGYLIESQSVFRPDPPIANPPRSASGVSPGVATNLPPKSAMAAEEAVGRIRGIVTHPEAQGREALAWHLALETKLTLPAAIETLRVAGATTAQASWDSVIAEVNRIAKFV